MVGHLRVTHPSATRWLSLSGFVQARNFQKATSFDLHVLGMPPAFILSQDQTLQKKYFKKLITATQIDVLLSFQRTKFSFFALSFGHSN